MGLVILLLRVYFKEFIQSVKKAKSMKMFIKVSFKMSEVKTGRN